MRLSFHRFEWLALLLLLATPGCQSTGTGPSGSLAAVVIDCPDEVRVRVAVIKAFEEEKFQSRKVFGPEMVFERRGSLTDDFMHGGWLSSKTVERIRVRITAASPMAFRVECNAFTVQYPDDRVMEEEFRIRRSGPYRQMLEDARQRVAQMQAAEGQPP